MKKLSSKNVLFALFAVVSLLIIGSCIAPVGSLEAFFGNDIVKEYIEEYVSAKVKLEDSDEDLIAGNERIEGLDPNKYYMVEKELDKEGKPATETDADGVTKEKVYPKYVTDYQPPGGIWLGPGGLIDDLGFIMRISGGAITSLTNFHTYTVKSAVPLSSAAPLSYNDGSGKTIPVVDGTAHITNPAGMCALTLSSVISGAGAMYYIAVPFPDDTRVTTVEYTKKSLVTTVQQATNTTVDYVFEEVGNPSNFKVLKVVIEPLYVTGGLTFTLNLVDLSEQATVPPPLTTSISVGARDAYNQLILNGNNEILFTLADTSGFTGITWKVNGTTYTANTSNPAFPNTFILRNSEEFRQFMIPGLTIEVTVEGMKNGRRWGAEVEITVN